MWSIREGKVDRCRCHLVTYLWWQVHSLLPPQARQLISIANLTVSYHATVMTMILIDAPTLHRDWWPNSKSLGSQSHTSSKPNERTINNRSMTKSLVFVFHFVSRRREHFLLPSVCFDRCIALFDIRKNRLGWLWLQFWQLLFILKNNPSNPKTKSLLMFVSHIPKNL